MTVKTKLGPLTAKRRVDSEYPSIDLFWGDRLVAALEYEPYKKQIRTLVWSVDDANEEPLFILIEPEQKETPAPTGRLRFAVN
jgi:hypothetical protein